MSSTQERTNLRGALQGLRHLLAVNLVLHQDVRLARTCWALEVVVGKYSRKTYLRNYNPSIKVSSSLFKPIEDCSEMSAFEWVGTIL